MPRDGKKTLSIYFKLQNKSIIKILLLTLFTHLNSRMILVGTPGTGRATTLMKRIAPKSDRDHIDIVDEIQIDPFRLG